MNLVSLSSHKSFLVLASKYCSFKFLLHFLSIRFYFMCLPVSVSCFKSVIWYSVLIRRVPLCEVHNKKVKENRHINPMCDIKTVCLPWLLHLQAIGMSIVLWIMHTSFAWQILYWVLSKCVKKIHYRVVLYITFHQDWSLLLKV